MRVPAGLLLFSFAVFTLGARAAGPASPPQAVSYETRHGAPDDLSLEEVIGMLRTGEAYPHAIRVRGRLESATGGGTGYRLCETTTRCLSPVRPVPEITARFEPEADNFRARQVELVGALEQGAFVFWTYTLATLSSGEEGFSGPTIEGLVNQQSPYADKNVTVRGQFRGANLFGDLPAGSSASPADWVISDGPFSLWVTGKPPKGSGFSLSPGSKADCVYWLEVEGRPAKLGEVVVLKAGRIRFLGRSPKPAPPPGDPRMAEPGRPPGRRRGP